MIPEWLSFRAEFPSGVKFVLHSHNKIQQLSVRGSGLRGFRARLNTHAPLAPDYKIAIFNPEHSSEQSSFSVDMLPEWNSYQSENLVQNENWNDLYGNKILSRYHLNRCIEIWWINYLFWNKMKTAPKYQRKSFLRKLEMALNNRVHDYL